ncbi:MAG: DUF3109 family protein [Luteolibacter sp.]
MHRIAYRESELELARQIREATIDYEAFEMPLKLCELTKCRATCCHDGVLLEKDEMAIIGDVIESRCERLAGYGWNPETYLTEENGQGRSVTLENPDPPEHFPPHFPKTRCVFLDGEHRCVLQRLAMDEGRHPWWWKPVSCWMHPLILVPGRRGERPLLTLARPGRDPSAKRNYPGFASCTPCGMEADGGSPAHEVLQSELRLLGEISGRDLVAETAP